MAISGFAMMLKMAGINPDELIGEVRSQIGAGVNAVQKAESHMQRLFQLADQIERRQEQMQADLDAIMARLDVPASHVARAVATLQIEDMG